MINYEVKNRIAYITFNRPEKRNALSFDMVSHIMVNLNEAIADDGVRAIVFMGAGKAFCSGADLESLQQMQSNTFDQNLADSKHLLNLFQLIHSCPKLTIAAVDGPALAGGCGLATLTDFTFASEKALFGYTEARIGFIPALVSVYLTRKIGETKAKHLLLNAAILSPEEAKDYDLVYQIVPSEQLGETVTAFAEKLVAQNSGSSIALTKELMIATEHLELTEALQVAAVANANARASADCQKGIASFLEKTTPSW